MRCAMTWPLRVEIQIRFSGRSRSPRGTSGRSSVTSTGGGVVVKHVGRDEASDVAGTSPRQPPLRGDQGAARRRAGVVMSTDPAEIVAGILERAGLPPDAVVLADAAPETKPPTEGPQVVGRALDLAVRPACTGGGGHRVRAVRGGGHRSLARRRGQGNARGHWARVPVESLDRRAKVSVSARCHGERVEVGSVTHGGPCGVPTCPGPVQPARRTSSTRPAGVSSTVIGTRGSESAPAQ